MRLKWNERAKRLAEEHNMVAEIESDLSKGIVAVGIERNGELIRWALSEGEIVVQEI